MDGCSFTELLDSVLISATRQHDIVSARILALLSRFGNVRALNICNTGIVRQQTKFWGSQHGLVADVAAVQAAELCHEGTGLLSCGLVLVLRLARRRNVHFRSLI